MRPTAAGSRPRCRCQKAWLTTTTRSLPATSSRDVKTAPSMGRTRSTSKKLAVTRSPFTQLRFGARRLKDVVADAAEGCHRLKDLLLVCPVQVVLSRDARQGIRLGRLGAGHGP